MKIQTIIARLLPDGSDAFASMSVDGDGTEAFPGELICPTWPPDLFAVAGRIIEQSGCYTVAGPARGDVAGHQANLASLSAIVAAWSADPMVPPTEVTALWDELVRQHGECYLDEVEINPQAANCVLRLFAIADEACKGMGWGDNGKDPTITWFTRSVLFNMTGAGQLELHLPFSLCCKVPPEEAVVLPKSITASVGCSVRSLSHYLALLPPTGVIDTSWTLPFGRALEEGQSNARDA